MKKVKYKRRDEIEEENKRLVAENKELKRLLKEMHDSLAETIEFIKAIQEGDKELLEAIENRKAKNAI